jgi:hypothetical protein
MGYGSGVIYGFTTAAHSSAPEALVTFSPVVWYPIHKGTTAAWALTALELRGPVMCVPAGLVLTAAGLIVFAAWLRGAERRTDAVLEQE